jgi:Xaa-Pro aminopeptidase
MSERVGRLQKRLSALGIDGLLLFDMTNIRYLTGFSGSDGACLIPSGGEGVLFVDGRYVTQAQEQARGVSVTLYRDKITGIATTLSDRALGTVGFESSALTFDLYARLKKQLKGRLLKPLADEVQNLRLLKDPAELASISRAVDVSHGALMGILAILRAGITEKEVACELEYGMKKLGAEAAAFPTIVASGPRAALPHAQPGLRKFRKGDMVIIDYGAVVDGYRSDETCTFIIGGVKGESGRIYGIVKEAHDRAIDAIRPGVSCREIDRIARAVIEGRGFGDHFSHGTGHGVGLDVHENPRLSTTGEAVLETGMVVTVEPGIYLPGRMGVRIEDMVVVEEGGCRVLTKTPKDMTVLH